LISKLLIENDPNVISGNQTISKIFESLKRKDLVIYVDTSYDIIAIISTVNTPTIEKFIYSKTALINHVADNVWNLIRTDFDKMSWIASKSNPLVNFYYERADGSYRSQNRIMFWYGFTDLVSLQGFITEIVQLEKDSMFGQGAW
jgi:N-acetyl-gamma-glutamyl-phosphate reductase/acetylglutamate kinase